MAKIAILLDTDFEQVDIPKPMNSLKLKSHSNHVNHHTTPIKQVRGLNHTDPADTFADLLIGEANAADYDAIVLPGGGANADVLRANTDAQAMVKAFMNVGKPVAAICHAPWILHTEIARGKKLTAYKTITATDLKNAGAQFEDKSSGDRW
ncbi:MAG: DJ-1/PfpI family protein [Moraxella osloensis]